MAISITGRTAAELGSGVEALDKQIEGLKAEHAVLEADLAGFECDGYDHFKEKVLPRELARLDKLRRTRIEPSDTPAQERIHGQQTECMLLMKSKEAIENNLKACMLNILGKTRERDGLQAKLNRKRDSHG